MNAVKDAFVIVPMQASSSVLIRDKNSSLLQKLKNWVAEIKPQSLYLVCALLHEQLRQKIQAQYHKDGVFIVAGNARHPQIDAHTA
jgi:hypothetical protein